METMTQEQYAIERKICDKAQKYATRTMAKNGGNYLTGKQAKTPVYAACNNDMRGRVEQFEILRDLPDVIFCYLDSNNAATVWTGLPLSTDGICTGIWKTGGWVSDTMEQHTFTIGGRKYTGRGQGSGMCIRLKETAESKRNRA